MKKKIVSTILCVAMMAMTLVGCGSSNKSGSVYWLNFKPESDEVLQDIAQTYTAQTGVEVKVVTAASGTYSQTLISEMDKSAPRHCLLSVTRQA